MDHQSDPPPPSPAADDDLRQLRGRIVKAQSPRSPEYAVAMEIAAALGERERRVICAIARFVGATSTNTTRELLEEAQRINAAGGMPTKDESRQRTLGGVFLYLAKQRVPGSLRKTVFPYRPVTAGGRAIPKTKRRPEARALPWGERAAVIDRLRGQAGTVRGVVAKVVAPVAERGDFNGAAFVTVRPMGGAVSLPPGVPAPTPLRALRLLIPAKQWRRVEGAARDRSDRLIVEGEPFVEGAPGDAVIVVFKTSSKKQLDAQRGSAS